MPDNQSDENQEFTQSQVDVGGLSINVDEAGSGKPVIILHRSTGRMGGHAFEQALAAGHHVLAPDLPGYGFSERPDWARDARDLAVLINGFARARELQDVTLVGLGIGGFIAAELATMTPAWMSNLVLIGAQGVKPSEGEITDQMLLGHADYVKACLHDEETFVDLFGEEVDKETRDMWDFNRIMTARICWSPYMFSRKLPPLLPLIAARTMIIWGDDDNVTPRICADQYASGIPGSRIDIVDNAGHAAEVEQPAAVTALISDFIKS